MKIFLAVLVFGFMAGAAFAQTAQDPGGAGMMPDRLMEAYQSQIDQKIASLDKIAGGEAETTMDPAEFPNTFCGDSKA